MSKLSNLIKPSLLIVYIIVINMFLSAITMVFFLDYTYSEDVIGTINSSLFICLFYFVLTRFNKIRIISQKFKIIESRYYNGMLLLIVISYIFLLVLYFGLTEQSKELVNYVFFIFIPIYIGSIFHIVNLISRTLRSNENIEDLFLPIKQKIKD